MRFPSTENTVSAVVADGVYEVGLTHEHRELLIPVNRVNRLHANALPGHGAAAIQNDVRGLAASSQTFHCC
jgi:hypothetical protein